MPLETSYGRRFIGYTNAGKSTLLNALTNSEVEARNELFVTLDPTSRRLRFPREGELVITDTVGFIADLPKDLVTAFRATLEELADADLLLHVVDAADPELERKISAGDALLADLELAAIPRLMVLNKADLLEAETARGLEERFDGVALSAQKRDGLDRLIRAAEERLHRRVRAAGGGRRRAPTLGRASSGRGEGDGVSYEGEPEASAHVVERPADRGRPRNNAEELRALQAPLKARYRENAAAGLVTLSAEGKLGEGVSCSVETGRALVAAGLHPATGGTGELACSGDMLLQALVACAGVTLSAVATALGIAVRGGRLVAAGGGGVPRALGGGGG